MTHLHRRLRHAFDDERGIAMVIAISVILLMTMIPLIVFAQAIQQLPLARHDQDHESALHAAEAGVDDYVGHLNNYSNYWTASTTAGSPDQNAAFSTWQAVPGPDTNEDFRYAIDNATTSATGVVTITSSGRANGVVRTVKVALRKLGFLDFLYLTDYELVDPVLTGESTSQCQLHAWQYNSSTGGYGPDANDCSVLYWTSQNVVNGPLHTNDGLYVCGNPTFNGNVDTYYNSPVASGVTGSTRFGGAGTSLNPLNCTNSPVVNRTGDPAPGSLLALPPGNASIQSQAHVTAGPGCLYTGSTTIAFHYSGTVGVMDVTSPATLQTKPGCGPGNNVALPSNGVVYVQNVPQSKSDPNYSKCSGTACNGDAFVSNAASNGGLAGQLTVAAANDVIIKGSITYRTYPGGTDVLGLVAVNDVSIYHPVNNNGSNGSGSLTSPTVDAAILSLNHSFYVENWQDGAPLGTLTLNGAIAQKFRGPVGTFSGSTTVTGYQKNYNYDSRLKYLTPPFFLNPIQSAWGRISFGEVKPGF